MLISEFICLIIIIVIGYLLLKHWKPVYQYIKHVDKTLFGGIANPLFQSYNNVDLNRLDYSKLSNIDFSNLILKAQDSEEIPAIKNLGFR